MLAVVRANDLRKLPSLIVLCSELSEELDGVTIPASAAAIVNGMRSLVNED